MPLIKKEKVPSIIQFVSAAMTADQGNEEMSDLTSGTDKCYRGKQRGEVMASLIIHLSRDLNKVRDINI